MEDVRDFFRRTFGGEPDLVGSAPGRVNLIGEHTDYNGGQVLPIAIERRTWMALRKASDGSRSRVRSRTQSEPGQFDARSPVAVGKWWDYVAGVCAAFNREGIAIPQFDAAVISDVPAGAGLSSSAALEVATAFLLDGLTGSSSGLARLAMMGWWAETGFVGVAAGVMDQYASAMCEESRALHLRCDTLQTASVPMKESVMIFDTVAPRSLRASEFNTRRAECEMAVETLRRRHPDLPNLAAATPEQVDAAGLPPVLLRRALHVTSETRRVERVVSALLRGGRVPGAALYESHESLRAQYECSTPELDWFVDSVRDVPGVTGARLTGAGWGGCAIAVGDQAALQGTQSDLVRNYEATFGRVPRVWLTRAAGGASLAP
ncbi:MAG TPA: galactokinase [Gemmatimonadaceae bacterium]|nr:galactokinase [Gemmatimonadaceae bacterium]